MRPPLGATMRVLEPAPGVLGFYDGRIPGLRVYSDEPNWLDDGAYELGICTYAIVDGTEALVYDTHISVDHARLIRQRLEEAGVRHIRVVLSHWHDDHVAGNAVFADCEIIANRLTAELLETNRETIERADPPIRPLVMPNRLFEGSLTLRIGVTQVELRQMDIHSQDGTVMLLPDCGLLFAGDTLEDPITYVAEPERLAAHVRDLERLAALPFAHILPDHGDPEIIATGRLRRRADRGDPALCGAADALSDAAGPGGTATGGFPRRGCAWRRDPAVRALRGGASAERGGGSGVAMARSSSKLVRHERHKLTETFLNTLAAGAIIAAFVGPAVALGNGTAHVPSYGRWAINAVSHLDRERGNFFPGWLWLKSDDWRNKWPPWISCWCRG